MAVPDEIFVTRNNKPLVELTDPTQLLNMTAFVNQRLSGWSVPWFGAPVGQIYFTFRKAGRPIGNFYVGPSFFGRDHGNFLSQSASKDEIVELGLITGLPVLIEVEGPST